LLNANTPGRGGLTNNNIHHAGVFNMRTFIQILSISLAVIFTLTACKPGDVGVTKKNKKVFVELKTQGVQPGPADNPGVIFVETPGNKCKKGTDKKGCIYFAADEEGSITFTIKGEPGDARSCSAPSTKEVISKIELTDTDKTPGGPEPTEKGDFSIDRATHPMPAKYKDDGFPQLDIHTGIVFEENNHSAVGRTKVKLENLNKSNVPNPQGLNIWYKVTLTTCDTPHEYWVTDPRIENGGMD
jgi:hypothetical protein